MLAATFMPMQLWSIMETSGDFFPQIQMWKHYTTRKWRTNHQLLDGSPTYAVHMSNGYWARYWTPYCPPPTWVSLQIKLCVLNECNILWGPHGCLSTGVSWSICPNPRLGPEAADTDTHTAWRAKDDPHIDLLMSSTLGEALKIHLVSTKYYRNSL